MLTKFFVPLSKSGFYTKRVSKSINNSLLSLTQRAVVGSDQRLSSSNFCFESVEIEYCFYVAHAKELSVDELNLLHWILTDPFGYSPVFSTSLFASELPLEPTQFVLELELGPRASFSSAFSTNAVSITRAAGISSISRIECSRRFRIFLRVTGDAAASLSGLRSGRVLDELREFLAAPLHDRMTECLYLRSLDSLSPPIDHEARCRVEVLPVIEEVPGTFFGTGERAISEFNARECLALDDWDVHFYTSVFRELGRNPTTIELFDLAQSNSEHCRHWFFKGDCVIDGVRNPRSLLQMVCDTQRSSNPNNTIKFSDNSSAIAGFAVTHLTPSDPTSPSPFTLVQSHFSKGNTSMQSEEALTDILFTAETHNFPTAVCPFEGAATGSGGRIRDVHATGRGAHVGVGTIGYAVGSLDDLPHVFDLLDSMSIRMSLDSDALSAFNKRPEERASSKYRSAGFADPISILIEGSNGASDYGNKFGEPLVLGFTRSLAMEVIYENSEGARLGEWREWLKPILFTGGLGYLSHAQIAKSEPSAGMRVAKIGGPVYRIGVGGGSASSVHIQGAAEKSAELDFNAVQRGDAQMEQKLNRLIRACIELGAARNPILSIHDQGAGGNGNVLKEIVSPAGARIEAAAFTLGDPSVSLRELWNAEYQESDAILLAAPSPARDLKLTDDGSAKEIPEQTLLEKVARRERCGLDIVGTVTGDGRVSLSNFEEAKSIANQPLPIDLELERVLGNVPRKTFHQSRSPFHIARPLMLPFTLFIPEALSRVMRLVSVGSKRFLTNKVDRSVSGRVAQQQCVGALQTPLADFALMRLGGPVVEGDGRSFRGAVTAIGEQPFKLLVDPRRGARLTLSEALLNLAFCSITSLKDVKCSVNWMWPAKSEFEGARLHDTCAALCAAMEEVGVAADGGKDSLSMAARATQYPLRAEHSAEALSRSRHSTSITVKAPGSVVVSVYAPVDDIRSKVTPDLKCCDPATGEPKETLLLFASVNKHAIGRDDRLGGSAFAQSLGQLGSICECPDIDDSNALVSLFNALQKLIQSKLILSGHDVSDGGLLCAALEMAIAGHVSLKLDFWPDDEYELPRCMFFSEEPRVLMEVLQENELKCIEVFKSQNIRCERLGLCIPAPSRNPDSTTYTSVPYVILKERSTTVFEMPLNIVRAMWEETSVALESLQCDVDCVRQELRALFPPAHFDPRGLYRVGPEVREIQVPRFLADPAFNVAVIREEGSNGDREMCEAFFMAGFRVWDVCMQDLLDGSIAIDEQFRGIAFVGGFSYADVFGSAKGWAAGILLNERLRAQFAAFRSRANTFSLGVCNGCQLMALLGWLDPTVADLKQQAITPNTRVFLGQNRSGRFESRFSAVSIARSKSVLLAGLEDSLLGVWVAHGEGRFSFRSPDVLSALVSNSQVAIRFVDHLSQQTEGTESYPANPNGSPLGIAGLCSPCGRHLALMPHPERSVFAYQWAYMPRRFERVLEDLQPQHPAAMSLLPKASSEAIRSSTSFTGPLLRPGDLLTPWFSMFRNAYTWCEKELSTQF